MIVKENNKAPVFTYELKNCSRESLAEMIVALKELKIKLLGMYDTSKTEVERRN